MIGIIIDGCSRHLHLHVVSADLCATALKKKKHYNSFHPALGFFLHLDQVIAWLDAELEPASVYATVRPERAHVPVLFVLINFYLRAHHRTRQPH